MPSGTLRRWLLKDDATGWAAHLQHVRSVRAWMQSMGSLGEPPATGGNVTAIVLSYLRPQNIDAILRSLLHTPSVGQVVLCNNHPDIAIGRFVSVTSPRLRIIQHAKHCGTPERLRIAQDDAARFFLAADDDLFLRPQQYDLLCQALKDDPSRPHGMFGQVMQPDGTFRYAVRGDADVDVLNRVYAFTSDHVRRFFEITGQLRFAEDDWKRSDWDDVVLSFSGRHRPRSHDVGAYLDCPTQGRKDTAVWRRDDFFERRTPLFRRLQEMTGSCTSSSAVYA